MYKWFIFSHHIFDFVLWQYHTCMNVTCRGSLCPHENESLALMWRHLPWSQCHLRGNSYVHDTSKQVSRPFAVLHFASDQHSLTVTVVCTSSSCEYAPPFVMTPTQHASKCRQHRDNSGRETDQQLICCMFHSQLGDCSDWMSTSLHSTNFSDGFTLALLLVTAVIGNRDSIMPPFGP